MQIKLNTQLYLVSLFLIALTLTIPFNVQSEGTKEIQPTQSSHGRLQLMPFFTNFAIFDAPQEHRLNITICQPGEKIYYGFGLVKNYNGVIQNDVVYRIKDPNGDIVIGPVTIPNSGAGFIHSYTEAVSGPNIINNSGYSPLSYTPTMLGDYYIEFTFSQPYGSERRVFDFFDITIVSANNQIKNGRLWSKNWQLTTNPQSSFNSPFQAGYDGKMYIYADDGIVTSVGLNNMQPFVFNITANNTGCFNSGNLIQDRKSSNGNNTYPQYKIFLNNPDSNCYPSGQFGGFIAPTTITGCNNTFCINIYVDIPGNIEVLIDLNGIPGYQPNTEDLLFVFNAVAGYNCIPWDGLDGLGNIILSGTYIHIEVNYFNGLTHLPLYDVEANPDGFKIEIVRPYNPNSNPTMYWDDTDVGGSLQLIGCNNSTGCHTWSIESCYQSPTPHYCSLGDMRTINTWWHANSIKITDSLLFENLHYENILCQEICQGSFYFWNGQYYAISGIYYDSLVAANGCDSINILNLHVKPRYEFYHYQEICEGEIFHWHGQNYNMAGIYYDSLTTTNGCDSVFIFELKVLNIPDINIEGTHIICKGEFTTITASGGDMYVWNTGATSSAITVTPQQTTTYTVSISGDNGCSNVKSVVVEVKSLNVQISSNGPICSGETMILNAVGGASYNWAGPNDFNSTEAEVSITNVSIENGGLYTVTVTDISGYCSETKSLYFNIISNPPIELIIPNVFTPNGDGINDVFEIKSNTDLSLFNCLIFNRWGKLMYDFKNINESWDGTFKNTPVSEGVYFFIVNGKNECNQTFEQHGFVSLFR